MGLTRNGSIEGKSQAIMFGVFKVTSRNSQFNFQNKDQAQAPWLFQLAWGLAV
jgi:hypothetical protein